MPCGIALTVAPHLLCSQHADVEEKAGDELACP